jgi:hypothetical protein
MAFQIGPVPNFNVAVPDVIGGQEKAATLAQMLNANALQRQLAPLQIQEQQQKAQQAGIATQTQQQEMDSRKAMMALVAGGELNKFAGVETPDGSGFDAAGAYQYMMSKGVLPAQAGEYANSWLTIGKNQAEISKNLGEAGKAQQEIREKTLKQVASKLGDIGDMTLNKATNALDAFRQDLVKNPKAYTGLTQQEMAELYSADLTHLDALAGHLGIAAQVADFHKSKAEAGAVEGKADPNSPFYDPSSAYLMKRAAAGDPEAKSILAQQTKQAGAKAGAEAAAKLPYELQLKQQETDQNPVFAVNPKTGQRELSTVGQAKAQGYANPMKVTTADVEKETALNSQMNDMQLNTSRYRSSLNAMGNLSSTDVKNIQRIITNPDIKGMLGDAASTAGWTLGMGSMSQTIAKEAGQAWNELSPDKQDAVIGYLRMKNTGLLAQKVLTGMGRASKEALDIELANMPAPNEGATVGNKKLDAWQENLDQINSRSVKLPWMEQPSDVKARIEGQAVNQYNQKQAAKPQGQYRGTPSQDTGKKAYEPGMTLLIRGVSRRVSRVYSDGTFDVQ